MNPDPSSIHLQERQFLATNILKLVNNSKIKSVLDFDLLSKCYKLLIPQIKTTEEISASPTIKPRSITDLKTLLLFGNNRPNISPISRSTPQSNSPSHRNSRFSLPELHFPRTKSYTEVNSLKFHKINIHNSQLIPVPISPIAPPNMTPNNIYTDLQIQLPPSLLNEITEGEEEMGVKNIKIHKSHNSPLGPVLCKPEIEKLEEENLVHYKFGDPDNIDNICLERGSDIYRNLKGASFTKLIEKVSSQLPGRRELRDLLLTTYENYTTGEQLLKALIQRFLIPPPPQGSMSNSELLVFNLNKVFVLQNFFFDLLKKWLEIKKNDFLENGLLRELLHLFILHVKKSPELYSQHKILITVQIEYPLNKLSLSENVAIEIEKSMHNFTPNDKIELPLYNLRETDFFFERGLLEIKPVLIATQLCLIDQKYFGRITNTELLQNVKSRKKRKQMPNIKALIERHNLFSVFIGCYILLKDNRQIREETIKQFIKVGQECVEMHNLNSGFIIYHALNTYIQPLKKTWTKIYIKYKDILSNLQKLFSTDKNFRKLREHKATIELPCIPCFLLWGKDLDLIKETHKGDFLDDEVMINVYKQRAITEKLVDLRKFQSVKHSFYSIAILYEFLDVGYGVYLKNIMKAKGMNLGELELYLITRANNLERK